MPTTNTQFHSHRIASRQTEEAAFTVFNIVTKLVLSFFLF